jgi:hypothetical protein
MWSNAVKVHPWIGSNYEVPKHFPRKTLILGESNFTKPELFGESLVQDCVRGDISDYSNGRDTTGFCRFSTKIRRILFGAVKSSNQAIYGEMLPSITSFSFGRWRISYPPNTRDVAKFDSSVQ